MSRLLSSALLASAMLLTGPALAYTPESGFWWNPNEPGTGLQLEIQDNFIFVVGYTYDDEGNPLWVSAAGFLDDNASFSSSDNPEDGTWLSSFSGGQCIGCDFTGFPTAHVASEGPISLIFDPNDPTKAEMTWGGRTQAIERFQFYLQRGGDGAPIEITKMLGEWQVVQDFAEHPSNPAYPFYGDIIAFENIAQDGSTWLFEGCRPDDSLGAGCTEINSGSYYHDAAGLFDYEVDRQLILVTDSRDGSGAPQTCLLYDVQTGTDFFSGGLDYLHDGDAGGVVLYPCGDNPFNYDFYPVRGHRSASRTFIQEGYGPSKRMTPDFKPRSLSATLTPVKRSSDRALPAHAEQIQKDVALLLKRISTPHPKK